MYILEGQANSTKQFVYLGGFASKQALRDRLAEIQRGPRRYWTFRQITVVSKSQNAVRVVNFPPLKKAEKDLTSLDKLAALTAQLTK